MSSFNATSTASGKAYTKTDPSSLVTSSATSTASSNLSQDNAQQIADENAQKVADSVAQNNANIITQTLNLTTANLKGFFSYLTIYEAIETDYNFTSTPFSGQVIYSPGETIKNAIVLNLEKPIYKTNTLNPSQPIPTEIYPNAKITGNYSLTYRNFPDGGAYIDETFPANIQQPPANTKSVLSGIRTTYKYIPDKSNGTTYNIVIDCNVVMYTSFVISKTEDNTAKFNAPGGILNIIIVNKMSSSISTYSSDGTYMRFDGINMQQTYSPDGQWNYILSDFTNATLAGSSNSVTYPYSLVNN
jgi:hypothetical protein